MTVKYAGISIVNGTKVHFHTTNSTDGKIGMFIDLPGEEDISYHTEIVIFKLSKPMSKAEAAEYLLSNIVGQVYSTELSPIEAKLKGIINKTPEGAEAAKKTGIEALRNL